MPLPLVYAASRGANNTLCGWCVVGKERKHVDVGGVIHAGARNAALQVRQCETHTHVIGAVALVPESLLGFVPSALVGDLDTGCELFGILCSPAVFGAVVRIERKRKHTPCYLGKGQFLLASVAPRVGDRA